MKSTRYLFLIILLASCTANSFYTSRNSYSFKEFESIDTLFVYTKTSSIVLSDQINGKSFVTWQVNKSQLKHFSIQTNQQAKTAFITDTLSNIPLNQASEIQLNLQPHVVVALFNDFGKTVIHFSGKTSTKSISGSTALFLVRNDFLIESNEGAISVKLSDTYDHSGFIRSQSGSVQVYTGNISKALQLESVEYNPQSKYTLFKPSEFTSVNPPFLRIEAQLSKVKTETTGTILW